MICPACPPSKARDLKPDELVGHMLSRHPSETLSILRELAADLSIAAIEEVEVPRKEENGAGS